MHDAASLNAFVYLLVSECIYATVINAYKCIMKRFTQGMIWIFVAITWVATATSSIGIDENSDYMKVSRLFTAQYVSPRCDSVSARGARRMAWKLGAKSIKV